MTTNSREFPGRAAGTKEGARPRGAQIWRQPPIRAEAGTCGESRSLILAVALRIGSLLPGSPPRLCYREGVTPRVDSARGCRRGARCIPRRPCPRARLARSSRFPAPGAPARHANAPGTHGLPGVARTHRRRSSGRGIPIRSRARADRVSVAVGSLSRAQDHLDAGVSEVVLELRANLLSRSRMRYRCSFRKPSRTSVRFRAT